MRRGNFAHMIVSPIGFWQAVTRHGTAPTASAALGRTLLGTLLISTFKAEGEKTQVLSSVSPVSHHVH